METLEEAPTEPGISDEHSETPLRLTADGLTDAGKCRQSNEDHFAVAEVRRLLHVRCSNVAQPSVHLGKELGHLLVVADGIGGCRAGERASAMAVARIEDLLLNTIGWLFRVRGNGVLAELRDALRATDRWVEEAAKCEPEMEGMGTTLTMAYVTGASLYIAHAGDSRCYLHREGHLQRLTRDHTFVETLVAGGLLTPEQAAHHEMRNIVLNAVGAGLPAVQPEVHKHVVRPGDALLLCSDGLTDMVPEREISAILEQDLPLQDTCRALVDAANRLGGEDNITVVVARLDRA
jgi:PPM family protein phosphatase